MKLIQIIKIEISDLYTELVIIVKICRFVNFYHMMFIEFNLHFTGSQPFFVLRHTIKLYLNFYGTFHKNAYLLIIKQFTI